MNKEKETKDREYNLVSNVMVNVLNFVTNSLAFIYSFGVLYAIGASWLLWLVWAFMHFIIFFNHIFFMLNKQRHNEIQAENLEKWKREAIGQMQREIQESFDAEISNI